MKQYLSLDFLKQYFLYFFLYSVLGWCYEVFLEVVVYGWGFSNRGFLWGPYCPVYGFGALLFLFLLQGLKEKKVRLGRINISPLLVFVAAMILSTALELGTSYLLEYIQGYWLWDYRAYAFQFQGRIALSPSLRFGLGGLLILYGIQPFFHFFVRKLGTRGFRLAFWISFLLFMADLIAKLLRMLF